MGRVHRNAALIAIVCLAVLPPFAPRTATAEAGDGTAAIDPRNCRTTSQAYFFVTPRAPGAGEALRVVAIAAKDSGETLVVQGPDGTLRTAGGGPGAPSLASIVEIEAAAPGTYRAALRAGGSVAGCLQFTVPAARAYPRPRPARGVWA